jgi:hypothetical protein
MSTPYSIIIVEEIDNTQRTLIHELVKSHSADWWHDLPDVWVVKGGGTANEWMQKIAPMVPLLPSSAMVLALKESKGHRWASQGRLSSVATWMNKAHEDDE